jgi:hypothetical protein
MYLGLGFLDQTNRVNWDSPLLRGIRSWNLALPNERNGTWRNLVLGTPVTSVTGWIGGTGFPLFGYQAFVSDGQPLVTAYSGRPGGFNKLNTRMHTGGAYSTDAYNSPNSVAFISCEADSSWVSAGTNIPRSCFAWIMNWKYGDGTSDSGEGLQNGSQSSVIMYTKPTLYSSSDADSNFLMFTSGQNASSGRRKLCVSQRINSNGYSATHYTSTATIDRWRWYHVGYSYDGAGLLRLYVNGNLDATYTGVTLGAASAPQEMRYGDLHYAELDFRGSMDDLRYYERFIEFDEYKNLYRESLGGHKETLNWIDDSLVTSALYEPSAAAAIGATAFWSRGSRRKVR